MIIELCLGSFVSGILIGLCGMFMLAVLVSGKPEDEKK